MNWSVTYRAKDGGQTIGVFEAESREALFKVLADNGITAMRVEIASGKHKRWGAGNRGSGSSHPSSPILHPLLRGLVAGVAVVALAFGVWYFLMRGTGNGERGTVEKPKKQSKIAVVTPAPVTTKPLEVKVEPHKVDPNARPTKVGEELNGYVMLPNGKMHRRRGIRTVEPGGVDRSHPAAIFDHSTDNEFAVILTLQPGESLIGGPIRHGKNYEEMFRKSLETPIIVSKDDPDDVQALKRAVLETRLAMKDALDRGEDIKKIVDEAYVEAQKLSLYKETLREQINEAVRNGDMTDDDLGDLVSAANKMLESKGIAPMKFGALTRARIRNLKK